MTKLRNFMRPGRSVAYATECMVATSSPIASAIALNVLRRGGNAVDAGIAACAALSLCEPQQTGIGGDCFALVAPSSGEVAAFNGSGRLPGRFETSASEEPLAPLRRNDAAVVTIPGAIDAWCALLERFGSLTIGDVLEPAIELATTGTPLQERVAFDIKVHLDRVREDAAFARLLLDGDKPKPVGSLYTNPALARTLERVATQGRSGFYEGEVAERLCAFLNARGGAHQPRDFAEHHGEFTAPVALDFRGHQVYQCGPNTQGVVTLYLLGILAQLPLDPEGVQGAWRCHSLSEASRLAFHRRSLILGDPAQGAPSWDEVLTEAQFQAEASRIDPNRCIDLHGSGAGPFQPDTVCLSVVDRDRNAFSLVNSLFDPFGSSLYEPETGIMLHSRGRAFRREAGHPNEARPGRRPLHTLIPGIVTKNDRTVLSYGVMGGNFQPVGHAQVLSALFDYGTDLQEALEVPRYFPQDGKLWIEPDLPEAVQAHLRACGHELAERIEPIGGAQFIRIDHERGTLAGASDSRKDGLAIGY